MQLHTETNFILQYVYVVFVPRVAFITRRLSKSRNSLQIILRSQPAGLGCISTCFWFCDFCSRDLESESRLVIVSYTARNCIVFDLFDLLLCRTHLEASADKWNRLLKSLEELICWLDVRDDEVKKQMPVGGDVPTVQQQYDFCKVSEKHFCSVMLSYDHFSNHYIHFPSHGNSSYTYFWALFRKKKALSPQATNHSLSLIIFSLLIFLLPFGNKALFLLVNFDRLGQLLLIYFVHYSISYQVLLLVHVYFSKLPV